MKIVSALLPLHVGNALDTNNSDAARLTWRHAYDPLSIKPVTLLLTNEFQIPGHISPVTFVTYQKGLRWVKFISGKSYIAHPVLYNLSRWWNGLESFAPVGTTLVYLHAASSPLYLCSSGVTVKCKYILCIWQSFRTYVGRGKLTLMVDTIEYKYPNGGKTQII